MSLCSLCETNRPESFQGCKRLGCPLKKFYRPLYGLPLRIEDSELDGQGVFATQDIPAMVNLGPCHFQLEDHFIRLPLGGFINFADEPNCERQLTNDPYWTLWTTETILAGEELTLKYQDYDPTRS